MKRTVMGILAPVDAGKTTLSEALLFQSGTVRTLGRVDHGNAFLDTDAMERERGITIFSKQAVIRFPKDMDPPEREFYLLDTPGHVDFSAEAERVIQVLDCAVFVVSATDGIGGHARTLWRLLSRAQIPVFIFVNKMDLSGTDQEALVSELKENLDGGCVDFNAPREKIQEEAALCDENLLESYLESGEITDEQLCNLIAARKLFPCCFGSALKLDGVDTFFDMLARYAPAPQYPDKFGARVFKITRDAQGKRLTWVKITGGVLRVKQPLGNTESPEKVEQLRIYSGIKYKTVESAPAGSVCALTGLARTQAGDGLGYEPDHPGTVTEPPLSYEILTPDGTDLHTVLPYLRQLEEEDPQLHVSASADSIRIRLMGEVQREILCRTLRERFGVNIEFGAASVSYRETIAHAVEGVGHFEPLRHYAEVRLLLEPLPPGSGLVFSTACPTDALALHWQRLILTHLAEREHLGVLTGSPVTDMRITLLAGRAHEKHTEGGDFREACYRAVRQGLMSAESVLLEPWYAFRLEVPSGMAGRAMTDLRRMGGEFQPPDILNETAVLTGSVPVAAVGEYAQDVRVYTKGGGHFFCEPNGFRPCQNPDEIIDMIAYDPERDTENPAGSVFCSHGAGVYVPWDAVPLLAHTDSIRRSPAADEIFPIDSGKSEISGGTGQSGNFGKSGAADQSAVSGKTNPADQSGISGKANPADQSGSSGGKHHSVSPDYARTLEQDQELKAIFERTYGPVKERRQIRDREAKRVPENPQENAKPRKIPSGPEYLLIDGYNIIFAWEDLKRIAGESLDAARTALCDLLCEYRGIRNCEVIVVFDAYKVKNNPGSHEKYHNIHVVYTKEAETADTYIERASYQLGREHRVRVATSDGPEQLIILGHGALRVSASMFRQEMEDTRIHIRETLEQINRNPRNGTVRAALEKAQKRAAVPKKA